MSKKSKQHIERAELQVVGDRCISRTPYHRDFVTAARGLGGHWEATSKHWSFPLSQWDLVQELVRRCYPDPIVHTPGELAMLKVRRDVLAAQLADVEHRIEVIEIGNLLVATPALTAHLQPGPEREPTSVELEDAGALFDLD